MSVAQEQVRCNICEVLIDVSKTKEHAVLQSHAEQKAKLESELQAVRVVQHDRDDGDDGDSSVASRWRSATLQ